MSLFSNIFKKKQDTNIEKSNNVENADNVAVNLDFKTVIDTELKTKGIQLTDIQWTNILDETNRLLEEDSKRHEDEEHCLKVSFIECFDNNQIQNDLNDIIINKKYNINQYGNIQVFENEMIIESSFIESFSLNEDKLSHFINLYNKKILKSQNDFKNRVDIVYANGIKYIDIFRPPDLISDIEISNIQKKYQLNADTISNCLKSLNILERIHFNNTYKRLLYKKYLSPYDTPFYKTQFIGLDITVSSENLFKLPIFKPSFSVSMIFDDMSKNELITLSEQISINVKKSWNKDKIIQTILNSNYDEYKNKSENLSKEKLFIELDNSYKNEIEYYEQWQKSINTLFEFFDNRANDVRIQ